MDIPKNFYYSHLKPEFTGGKFKLFILHKCIIYLKYLIFSYFTLFDIFYKMYKAGILWNFVFPNSDPDIINYYNTIYLKLHLLNIIKHF